MDLFAFGDPLPDHRLITRHLGRCTGTGRLESQRAAPWPVPDRLCLQGILYVLYNDIAWQLLFLEPVFGSGPRPVGGRWSGGRRGRVAVIGAPVTETP
ncbi:hypothetical protein SALBM311S_08862 [Streptomyces alboniger]